MCGISSQASRGLCRIRCGRTLAAALVGLFLPAAFPLPALSGTALTNGLVVYLGFDGNLNASSPAASNATVFTGTPHYTNGVVGLAAQFRNNGANQLPSDWAASLGNLDWVYAGSFSVSLWMRTWTSVDSALLGNKDWTSGSNTGWVITPCDTKNVNVRFVGGTRVDVDLTPPMIDGRWRLVTATFDRALNTIRIYVEGFLTYSNSFSPNASASLGAGLNTLVGSSGLGYWSGSGDLDELAIWTRALSAGEVSELHARGRAGMRLTDELLAPGVAPSIQAFDQGGALSFQAVSNAGSYRVEWTADLLHPAWGVAPHGVSDFTATNAPRAITTRAAPPGAEPVRFYRVVASRPAVLTNAFDSSNEGWATVDFPFESHFSDPATAALPYEVLYPNPKLPVPDGSVRVTDVFTWTGISAPPVYLGDMSAFYGGRLSYALFIRYSDFTNQPAVVLNSGWFSLYATTPPPITNQLTTIEVPLTEAGWKVSGSGSPADKARFLYALRNLKGLYLCTEWHTGADDTSVSSVFLTPP